MHGLCVDGLCAFNDGVKFGKVLLGIYPTELESKVEHNEISIAKGKFIYKFS